MRISSLIPVRLSLWRVIAAVLLAGGAYAAYMRFVHGLGAATNLSDEFPWGLWIGFDVLVGVGIAAGGFVVAATVHIFRIENVRTHRAPGHAHRLPRVPARHRRRSCSTSGGHTGSGIRSSCGTRTR